MENYIFFLYFADRASQYIKIKKGKLHVSAYSGHHQFLTTFLLEEFYIICLNRVAMLRSHHHLRAYVLMLS